MRTSNLLFIILLILTSSSCQKMSETVKNNNVGMNGGFEVWKDGLPVNWQIYTPKTVPDADFEIVEDNDRFKEGKRSICFKLNSKHEKGGWKSPGISKEFDVAPNSTYEITYYSYNEGVEYRIYAGPISSHSGQIKKLWEADGEVNGWLKHEFKIESKDYSKLRFEFSLIGDGEFWIDDFKLKKLPN